MKKWIALLLAVLLLLSAAACARSNDSGTENPGETSEGTDVVTVDEPEVPLASGSNLQAITVEEEGALASDTNLTPASGSSDLALAVSRGAVYVGVETDKLGEGEWTGFDADLADAFAASLSLTVLVIDGTPEELADLLDRGVLNCIWTGLTPDQGLSKELSCSTSLRQNDGEAYVIGFRPGSDMTAKLNDFLATCADNGNLAALAKPYGLTVTLG